MALRHGPLIGYPGPQGNVGQLGIGDSQIAELGRSGEKRWLVLALCVGLGALAGLLLTNWATEESVLSILCLIAFLGGLLSTWSPCGYSSLSLLRPAEPYGPASLGRWLPTLAAHAVGYVAGGLVLAAVLVMVGWVLSPGGFSGWALVAVGSIGLAYGLHQLEFLRIPYPQRRAQVSHGARMRLPMWTTGLLYGWQLGLNFVTYVRTPILYLVVVAAALSGSAAAVVLLVLSVNLGRFLPLLVNIFPLPDWTVQRWMAIHERDAVLADACILLFGGTLLLVWGLA